LNTGLRRQEALNLKWGDIDLEQNVIALKFTKTGQTRYVPLNSVARRCIEEVGEELFHSFNARYVSGKFQEYLENSNITGMKLHSLRHTFATNLYKKGTPIPTIQKLLGHKSIQTTLRYAKVGDEAMKDAVEKLCGNTTKDGKVSESSPLYRKAV
jgi:integrase/recombinase XerD